MVTKELVDYIREKLKAGSTKESIKNELLNTSWGSADIEEAFSLIETTANDYIEQDPVPVNQFNVIEQKNQSTRKFGVFAFIGIALVALIAFLFFLTNSSDETSFVDQPEMLIMKPSDVTNLETCIDHTLTNPASFNINFTNDSDFEQVKKFADDISEKYVRAELEVMSVEDQAIEIVENGSGLVYTDDRNAEYFNRMKSTVGPQISILVPRIDLGDIEDYENFVNGRLGFYERLSLNASPDSFGIVTLRNTMSNPELSESLKDMRIEFCQNKYSDSREPEVAYNGANSAVETNLKNLTYQAEVTLAKDSSYENFCEHRGTIENLAKTQKLITGTIEGVTFDTEPTKGFVACLDGDDWFVLQAPLELDESNEYPYYCVDSKGHKGGVFDPLSFSSTQCVTVKN